MKSVAWEVQKAKGKRSVSLFLSLFSLAIQLWLPPTIANPDLEYEFDAGKMMKTSIGVAGAVPYGAMEDCTSLGYGSSCNGMDKEANTSYALNMYFHMQNQDVRACDLDWLAKIVSQNASHGSCLRRSLIDDRVDGRGSGLHG